MYKAVLIMTFIFFAGCGGGGSSSSGATTVKTTESSSEVKSFLIPNQELCEKYDGIYIAKAPISCKMQWYEAQQICAELGVTLPSIERLKEFYATELDSFDTTIHYWSSEPRGSGTIYNINFEDGTTWYCPTYRMYGVICE